MNTTKRVAIMFGGKSAEHEISLISAMNIIKALDRQKYTPLLIGVDKDGMWQLQEESEFLAQDPNPKTVRLTTNNRPIGVVPGNMGPHLLDLMRGEALPEPDVVFGILHGPYGEDGSMQGLLQQLDLPYVGPGVAGSAVAMDKDLAKRLFSQAGIPNSRFEVFKKENRAAVLPAAVAHLNLPWFVKPARLGSSVGVSKVSTPEDLARAVDLAFEFDTKILIEEGIKGREIECAVLGNAHPKGSVIGEVVPPGGFYDYEAKYIDADGAKLLLPAPGLDDATVKRIQEMAVRAFQVLECEGLSRVDFFLTDTGDLLINEINTLPGFTNISMYPSLWKLSGIAYPDLIDQLLTLAMERKATERSLKTEMTFS
jgi:D-alanine-D-alanine ligase